MIHAPTVTSEKYGLPGHIVLQSRLWLVICDYDAEVWWQLLVIELRKMCYYFGGSSVTGANELIKVSVSRIISYALFVNKVSCQLWCFSRVYIWICMTQGNANKKYSYLLRVLEIFIIFCRTR
jgi:hypothetical protein